MEILRDTQDAVRILTIANERIHNAFGAGMAQALLDELDEADRDPAIRVVVVTGAGSAAFSTGHDLREIESGAYLETDLGEAPFLRPLTMDKPVIAAVNGHCYAAAFILALSCDIRVASENAEFGSPGARLGMLPEGGQLSRLPTLLPRAAALEMMMTAAPLTAQAACRLGFVSQVVPRGQALAAGLALAHKIAANAPAVITAIKKGVQASDPTDYDAALEYEFREARRLEQRADAKEGVRAFFEKRAPLFTGQ
ncbi:enoyl-CoA hydratase/isomerase family protein [Bordetella trematum]|uniref:enoyl-CoA hydratase/isomerase family protein n=1 Tax=Bordetella trematum TaxID=123899 RepID=UPI000D837B7C|nr:enoyl-CoA hydratase/isomerase family protein [Bordetella trematum]SPU51288.1 carnitinyl-CoA dehydratase [Bordetella trematum]VDH05630.1 Carnitinyl-CoA dehydratase [Bordetella trematum]